MVERPHGPLHAELLGDGREPALDAGGGRRGLETPEHHADEEAVLIVELVRVADVAGMVGEELRDRGHDAGAVRADEGDDVFVGHGG